MRLFQVGLEVYRRTLKRSHSAHAAAHWLMERGLLPLLEAVTRFETTPDDPFWLRMKLLADRHERETTRELDRLVRPGMVVLDVGAHVGFYARRFAKRVGSQGLVFAFEPHPRNFEVLSRNVRRLPNVVAASVAAADGEGTVELHDDLITSASASLRRQEAVIDAQRSRIGTFDVAPRLRSFVPRTYTVRTITLDAFLEERSIEQVDVVKMDIEGAEVAALRGMKRTIARSPGLVLVMEYNPHALCAFGHRAEEAVVEVLGLGFDRVVALVSGGGRTDLASHGETLRTLTRRLADEMGVVNLLFSEGAATQVLVERL